MSVISAAFMAFYESGSASAKNETVDESRYKVTYRKILLVGKDQKNGVPQLILVQHAL